MTIDFHQIRVLNHSQNAAFEELCCQLAHAESYPDTATFQRKGSPDAGVECFWTLEDGSEHGWQAKYFFAFGDSQRRQLDESIKTAFQAHPRLTRYVICVPMDLSDGRVGRQWTQLRHWKSRVSTWEKWAARREMHVDFELWGQHELALRLTSEEHAGRRFFWFGDTEFSAAWLDARMQEAVTYAGPRYSPEMHVNLPICEVFDGIGITDAFISKLSRHFKGVKERWRLWINRTNSDELIDEGRVQLGSCIENIATIVADLGAPDLFSGQIVELKQLTKEAICLAADFRDRADSEAYAIGLISDYTDAGHNDAAQRAGNLRDFYDHFREVLNRLVDFQRFLASKATSLADHPFALVSGEAGSGKTHLLCDVASRRTTQGAPTLLLFGQHFGQEVPWKQIVDQLHLSCTRDEFLGAFDAASEAAGVRGLILIDALNETSGMRANWQDHLPAMVRVLIRFPHLGFAVSCRSTYLDSVVRDDLFDEFMTQVVHEGFDNCEFEATRIFFDYYGIRRPSVPFLHPEFSNPLFLKWFCEGLCKSGHDSIPAGSLGLTRIFDTYLYGVNRVLSRADRLDFHRGNSCVPNAIKALAHKMGPHRRVLPLAAAQQICDNILLSNGYTQSLLHSLISEGILWEDIESHPDAEASCAVVRFTYERFADYETARTMLADALQNKDDDESACKGLCLRLFGDQSSYRQQRGLAQALAVLVPENTDFELFELLSELNLKAIDEDFLQSVIFRDSERISTRTLDYLKQLQNSQTTRDIALKVIVSLSLRPEHPLNSKWLHDHLHGLSLAERDAGWSIFLSSEFGNNGVIDRLLDWAWPRDGDRRDFQDVDSDTIELAAITLSWFLTTSDRYVRDRATYGLVSLLKKQLPVLLRLLRRFSEVNDPYVIERLYAVAYGCIMLSDDDAGARSVARFIFDAEFAANSPHPHLLLRDYARGVIGYTHREFGELDRDMELSRPPFQSEWPLESSSFEKARSLYEGQDYHGITSSLESMGDFFNYTMSCVQCWSNRSQTNGRTGNSSKSRLVCTNESDSDEYTNTEKFCQWWQSLSEEKQQLFLQWHDSLDETKHNQLGDAFCEALTSDELTEFMAITADEADQEDPEPLEPLDKRNARDWVFQYVINLGWTPDLFADFDSSASRGQESNYRTAHKAERIGKKYQWIAFHKLLAHASDNCQFRGRYDAPPARYEGPWQIGMRDIDPSLLMRHGHDAPFQNSPVSWWSPKQYAFDRNADIPHEEWLREVESIPPPHIFIEVTRNIEESKWVTLCGFYRWNQSVPLHKVADEVDRRQLTLRVQAYLVPKRKWRTVSCWLKAGHHRKWNGLPDQEVDETFLGEYPWHPSVNDDWQDYPWLVNDSNYRELFRPPPPFPLADPVVRFSRERDYDCSSDETFAGYLPAPWMMNKMQLRWAKQALDVEDDQGRVVAFDPSMDQPGPSSLLFSHNLLRDFLEKEELQLFWRVSCEKMIFQKDGIGNEGTWPGRMMAYWIFALVGEDIVQKSHQAVHITKGPREDVFINH